MRRTFAEVLREGKTDIENEYDKLYSLMYDKVFEDETESLYDIINESFPSFYFRGTCLSLEEFDKKYGFEFKRKPSDFDVEYLVSFCEYFWNMLIGLLSPGASYNIRQAIIKLMEQIRRVIDAIGYMESHDVDFVIFVEKSPAAISVSESQMIPKELSYHILEYNHHSLKGDIESKKQIIVQISNVLEPKRKELNKVNSSLESDLFYAFNNMNLRHNNTDPSNPGKYKVAVAEMNPADLENWYDEIYQMCLLSILELEHAERKIKFDKLKKAIEGGHPL